jgi:hypothetical protein
MRIKRNERRETDVATAAYHMLMRVKGKAHLFVDDSVFTEENNFSW